MIEVTDRIHVPADAQRWETARAGGPGGQHVNTTDSAARLRIRVSGVVGLSPAAADRLRKLAGSRLTADDELLIEARAHRSQSRNRTDAAERAVALIRQATRIPKQRRKTKPPRSVNRKRLAGKRQRAQVKQGRGKPPLE